MPNALLLLSPGPRYINENFHIRLPGASSGPTHYTVHLESMKQVLLHARQKLSEQSYKLGDPPWMFLGVHGEYNRLVYSYPFQGLEVPELVKFDMESMGAEYKDCIEFKSNSIHFGSYQRAVSYADGKFQLIYADGVWTVNTNITEFFKSQRP